MTNTSAKHQYNTQDFESRDYIEDLINCLNNQADILDEYATWISKHEKLPVNPFYRSLASKARAIACLSKNNFCTESFIISRSLIEHVVTLFYILGAEHETDILQDYTDFGLQKAYRNLDQTITINNEMIGIKYSGSIDLENNEDVQEAIDKFTTKNSKKEITRWSKLSLLERIKKIDDHTKVKKSTIKTMMAAMTFIYEKGSEALHATYFGCVFHFGNLLPGYDNSKYETKKEFYYHSLETILYISATLTGNINEFLVEAKPELKDMSNRIRKTNDKLINILAKLRKNNS